MFVALLATATPGAAQSTSPGLVEAAHSRDRARVTALLKQGADANGTDTDGMTALHWAARLGDRPIAAVLVGAGARVDAANKDDATPLWIAASNGDAPMVELLLKAGAGPNRFAQRGETPLGAAARSGNIAAVKALLANGANVNMGDSSKAQTALMWAVGEKSYPDVVALLLEHGANPNFRSLDGFTALHLAVRQHDVRSARILLRNGANVNAAGPGGISPLQMAIDSGDKELIALLRAAPAESNK